MRARALIAVLDASNREDPGDDPRHVPGDEQPDPGRRGLGVEAVHPEQLGPGGQPGVNDELQVKHQPTGCERGRADEHGRRRSEPPEPGEDDRQDGGEQREHQQQRPGRVRRRGAGLDETEQWPQADEQSTRAGHHDRDPKSHRKIKIGLRTHGRSRGIAGREVGPRSHRADASNPGHGLRHGSRPLRAIPDVPTERSTPRLPMKRLLECDLQHLSLPQDSRMETPRGSSRANGPALQ